MTEQDLRERLQAIVEYKAAWKRDPSGQFERIAEQFYRETGLMAPGKSVPLAMAGAQDDTERQQRWDEFTQRLSAERDATILEAAEALTALSAPAPLPEGAAESSHHWSCHERAMKYDLGCHPDCRAQEPSPAQERKP